MVPIHYGGGRPTVLIAYPPGAASALAHHDQWAEWMDWGIFKPKKGCFQRAPNTAVERLETWGKP